MVIHFDGLLVTVFDTLQFSYSQTSPDNFLMTTVVFSLFEIVVPTITLMSEHFPLIKTPGKTACTDAHGAQMVVRASRQILSLLVRGKELCKYGRPCRGPFSYG